MKEIVISCCRVAQKNPNLAIDEQSKDFWKWRDTILLNEDVLLEVLCFDLTIEPPHKLLYDMLKFYGVHHNKPLRNAAWGFVTDSNVTQLCLLCSSRTIAAAALYCAARYCDVAFPDTHGRPWWEAQNVRLKDMLKACNYMGANYEHTPLKGGAEGGQSIYVGLRTPQGLDGDDLPWERTRLKTEQAITSPVAPLLDLERSRRTSASSAGSKRYRDDTNGDGRSDPTAHAHDDERDSRRRRSDVQPGSSNSGGTAPSGPSAAGAPHESDGKDDGSEEGEVEE